MNTQNNETEVTVNFTIKKIYDPFLRILHAWNGICVLLLIVSMWFKNLLKEYPNGRSIIYHYHVYLGFALSIGLMLRLIWGFVGPPHAKFKNMFFIRDWILVLKTKKIDPSPNWGHDKYASFAYILFYFLLIYQSLSGLSLAANFFGMGPFTIFIENTKEESGFFQYLKSVHGFFIYPIVIYIIVHIGMIYIHEKKNKYPIAQSMFNGFQYRNKK